MPLLVYRHLMASRGRHPRRLQPRGSATRDQYPFSFLGSRFGFPLRFSAQRGVDPAAYACPVIGTHVPAIETARARSNLVEPAFRDLDGVLRIGEQAPRHADEIELALPQGLFTYFRVELPRDKDGQARCLFDRRGDGERKTPAFSAPVEFLCHEMFRELGMHELLCMEEVDAEFAIPRHPHV